MPEVSRTVIINAPQEHVFDIITDFESYPKFLSVMKDVTVNKKHKDLIEATFTIDVITTIKYTLSLKLKRPNKILWHMLEGQMMRSNTGSWNLKAVGKDKTEVTYSIDIGLGLLVPRQVTNILVGSNLPKMLDEFKKHSEKTLKAKKKK